MYSRIMRKKRTPSSSPGRALSLNPNGSSREVCCSGVKLQRIVFRCLLRLHVQPREPGAKAVLHLGIARHHEIDKLRNARFLRAWSAVVGNNDVRQSLDHRILRDRKKLRMIYRRLDLQPALPTCPQANAHLLNPGNCAAAAAVPKIRNTSRR